MRIVHTCLRYPPATGGVESYVQHIVQQTRNIAAGRDVRVLTSSMRTHGPISQLSPQLLLDDPIYIQRLHHAQTPLISYPRLQALRYYLNHHKPDIIHAYSYWYQPADSAARYAKKHRVPFFFHPIYYENKVRRKSMWQIYKRTIGRQTFAAADVVIVISPYEQSLIEAAGYPVRRFQLLPPGIDLARFSHPQPNPFSKRGIRGRIILSVSRLAPGKGLADMVTALADIKKEHEDVQLVLVGEDFGAQPYIEQLAKRLGVSQHVRFVGKLSDQELTGAYQHASLLIHPSYYEAFGIVPAEALAAGTPIVARNTSAIPFVVPHQKAGLLFNNHRELVIMSNKLLQNEALAHSCVSYGRRHVRAHFSQDVTIKKLIALYSQYDQWP